MTAPASTTALDWLRLKSHIFDPSTGRPTLAAVLEDVRRHLDEHDVIGLIYIDVGGGVRLEAQYGWQAYDERIDAVARAFESARRDGILGSTDIVAPMGLRSDKFVVFVVGPQAQPLRADELATTAAALEGVLSLAQPPDGSCGTGMGTPLFGSALVRRDPMLRAERAIHKALDEAMFHSLSLRSLEDERQARWLDGIIEAETIVTLFQPIVDLRTMQVRAHEVVTEGPADGPAFAADALIALAERTGRALAFERLYRKRALYGFSSGRGAGETQKLFLKVSTTAANDPNLAASGLARELEGTGLRPADVVFEVAERMAALDRNAFRATLHALKAQGFAIAIDDMGAGYSSLGAIAEMEPDFLKFDMSLVRNLDRNPIKRGLLETVVQLSGKVRAPVVAQGIEREGELLVIQELGVPLGQGSYLFPPAARTPVRP